MQVQVQVRVQVQAGAGPGTSNLDRDDKSTAQPSTVRTAHWWTVPSLWSGVWWVHLILEAADLSSRKLFG